MAKRDPQSAPQAAKKKKKKKKRENKGEQTKAADAGLKGFMDWTDPTASELAKEGEDDMSSLAIGFVARMRKRAASS